MSNPSDFSVRMADLRHSAHLEQKELATALKVTRLTIMNWEAGRSYPGYWSILEIARFFNVDMNWLMGHAVSEHTTLVRNVKNAPETAWGKVSLATMRTVSEELRSNNP